MENIRIQKQRDKLIIGDKPQLVVDLKNQNHYIIFQDMTIPYKKRIEFSQDLLGGKRENVLYTALNYFYTDACEEAEGVSIAREYRQRINTTVREIRCNSNSSDTP